MRTRKVGGQWSRESRAELLSRYEAGESQRKLAVEFLVTDPRINQLIFRAKRERLTRHIVRH